MIWYYRVSISINQLQHSNTQLTTKAAQRFTGVPHSTIAPHPFSPKSTKGTGRVSSKQKYPSTYLTCMQKYLRAAGIPPNDEGLTHPQTKKAYSSHWAMNATQIYHKQSSYWSVALPYWCQTTVTLGRARGKAQQAGSPTVERRTWSTWGAKWTDLSRGREGTRLLYLDGGGCSTGEGQQDRWKTRRQAGGRGGSAVAPYRKWQKTDAHHNTKLDRKELIKKTKPNKWTHPEGGTWNMTN